MEKNTTNEGLLDRIAHTLNCSYLSDLRDPALIASICSAISLIAAESYPLRDWKDAAEYITSSAKDFSSSEEARSYLMNYKI